MAITQPVRRGIEEVAIGRVLEVLHQQHRNGRRVFTLTELSEVTAIDPATVEDVMQLLEDTGPYEVEPIEFGERRWRVDGSVYDLDGWQSDVWNVTAWSFATGFEQPSRFVQSLILRWRAGR